MAKKESKTGYQIEDQGLILLYLDKIVNFRKSEAKQYKNFIRVNAENADDTRYFVNYLFSPKKVNKFVNTSPAFFSSILPRVRIYKVINKYVFDKQTRKRIKNNNLKSVNNETGDQQPERLSYTFLMPFEDRLTVPNIGEEISLKGYGKAYGAGVQNITINDRLHMATPTFLDVSINYLFTDFNIIFKKFTVPSEEDPNVFTEVSFKDLFNRDAALSKESDGTTAEVSDTSSFRIKLEVGWSYDEKLLRRINYGSVDLKESDIQNIKFALERSSYTYFLGHKSFELDINNEGKITATANYLGAALMDLKSTEASVLYYKEGGKIINFFDISKRISVYNDQLKQINEIPDKTKEISQNKKLTKEQQKQLKQEEELKKLKEAAIEKVKTKKAEQETLIYKHFLNDLFNNSKIHKITIPSTYLADLKKHFETEIESDTAVLDLSYIISQETVNIEAVVPDSEEDRQQKNTDQLLKKDTGQKKTKDSKKNEEKLKKQGNVLDSKTDKIIHYVYLGDILEYAFACLTHEKDLAMTVPMVGCFTYSDTAATESKYAEKTVMTPFYKNPKVANMVDIPISLERFKKFLFENFINSKVQAIQLELFITKLFNELVFSSMSGNVFGAHMRKHFGNLVLGSCSGRTIPSEDGKEEIEFFTRRKYQDIIDRKFPLVPFILNSVDSDIIFKQEKAGKSYLVNYFYIFMDQTDNLSGKVLNTLSRDSSGIVDIQIGADKGIFKKVSFSKSQLSSRLAPVVVADNRDLSRSNPLFLSGILNADVEMFGNTFFSVGSIVYVDPSFLLNSPDASVDEVIEFGAGGFYSVTSINHNIEAGKFTTKMNIVLKAGNDFKKKSNTGDVKTVISEPDNIATRKEKLKKIDANIK